MKNRYQRAIAAVFAIHGVVGGSLATRIPWIQGHLGLDPQVLGLAMLCSAAGAIVAMPMAGRLAHRYGGRTVTRVTLALWCAGLALPALSPGLAALCAVFFVYGAAAGSTDVVMNSQGVLVERRLGRSVMSGLHGMWSVGNLAGAGVGAVVAQAGIDARVHLGVMAVVLLALGGVLGGGLLEGRPEPGEQAPPRFAVPSRTILIIGLVGLCATFVELSGTQWAAVYTVRVAGASEGVGAACYTAFAAFMVVTRLSGDLVVRRLGAVVTVRTGAVVATVGGVIVAAGRTPVLSIVGFSLLGVGVAVVVPLVMAAAGHAARTPGQGVAGAATITYLSGLVAPAVIGWVAGVASFPIAFGLIVCFTVAMGCLAGVLRPARAGRSGTQAGTVTLDDQCV
jgi:hypothetical protein